MTTTVSALVIPESPELQHDFGERYRLLGAIDFGNAGSIMSDGKRRFMELERVTIDLSLADVASTPGLAVLLEWVSWCDPRGIPVVYEGVPPDVLAVAKLNGVELMLPVSREDS